MLKKIGFALTLFAVLSMSDGAFGARPSAVPEPLRTPWGEEMYAWRSWMPGGKTIISQYDPIIRRVASEARLDWRLVSAVANAESRFDHDAVSGAGAVGLMQVMPSVARGFNVPESRMTDPVTNVTMGVKHLARISKMFRFPESISERDRLSIILASYNCGPGRVLDARRLAVKYGENHNSWNVVSKYLTLMGEETYYEDEVVRTGPFNDPEQTLGFVRKVMRYYDSYRKTAAL